MCVFRMICSAPRDFVVLHGVPPAHFTQVPQRRTLAVPLGSMRMFAGLTAGIEARGQA